MVGSVFDMASEEAEKIAEIWDKAALLLEIFGEIQSQLRNNDWYDKYRDKCAIKMLARFEREVSYCMDKDIDNVQEVVKTLDQFKNEIIDAIPKHE